MATKVSTKLEDKTFSTKQGAHHRFKLLAFLIFFQEIKIVVEDNNLKDCRIAFAQLFFATAIHENAVSKYSDAPLSTFLAVTLNPNFHPYAAPSCWRSRRMSVYKRFERVPFSRPTLATGTPFSFPSRYSKEIEYQDLEHSMRKRMIPPLKCRRVVALVRAYQKKRADALTEIQQKRRERRVLSKQIERSMNSEISGNCNEIAYLKAKVTKANDEINSSICKYQLVQKSLNSLTSELPNTLDGRVPKGSSALDNVILKEWESPTFNRKVGRGYLWHDAIIEKSGHWHSRQAVSMAGYKFVSYSGWVSKLERALIQFFLDTLTQNGNYTEFSVPLIVSESALTGTGQLPKFVDDVYSLSSKHSFSGERGYLIPTAEVPLVNLFRHTTIDNADLPISAVSATPCFRAEAGTYGIDSRGLFRQHIFNKVEIVKICRPEDSEQQHETLTADAEKLLQLLKLPYRKVLLCSKETGFTSAITYDLEVWMPGQQKYREISSCSNCHDFQASRMGIRYRDERQPNSKRKSPKRHSETSGFCHTINGSALAVGRALMAVIENYQWTSDDGVVRVSVPYALQPYLPAFPN